MVRVVLAQPRGFCAGVVRAIEIVERALERYGRPVYVRHEIVHNRHVVENLKAKGAIFVEELDEVPAGAITVFSAHGVSKKVVADAQTDKLLGVHMIGGGVSELIGEVVAIMEFGGSAEDLARTIHAHPTLAEVVKEAALAVDKRAIHM